MTDLQKYVLHLADNALIHSHRLSEWCGHGPALEADMALSNFALDSLGAATSFYTYGAQLIGNNNTEDSLAFLRTERDFLNIIMLEQPHGNFADTIIRCMLFDNFQYLLYKNLADSADATLASIAEKSLKEVTYHLRFSNEWTIRLGDGTEESKLKMQTALNSIWSYTGEMFNISTYEKNLLNDNIAVNVGDLHSQWQEKVFEVLNTATLEIPESGWMQSGGKNGVHSEHLGFILTDMQYLQRAYPNAQW